MLGSMALQAAAGEMHDQEQQGQADGVDSHDVHPTRLLVLDSTPISASDLEREGSSADETLRGSCCLRRPYGVIPHGLYTDSTVAVSNTSNPPPAWITS